MWLMPSQNCGGRLPGESSSDQSSFHACGAARLTEDRASCVRDGADQVADGAEAVVLPWSVCDLRKC